MLEAGAIGGLKVVDGSCRGVLEVLELAAVLGDEAVDSELGRDRRVLHDRAGSGRGEALLDEAAQHVVDTLAGEAGLARNLGGGERVTTEEGDVRLGLVRGQAELGELGNVARQNLHIAWLETTPRGVKLRPHIKFSVAGQPPAPVAPGRVRA